MPSGSRSTAATARQNQVNDYQKGVVRAALGMVRGFRIGNVAEGFDQLWYHKVIVKEHFLKQFAEEIPKIGPPKSSNAAHYLTRTTPDQSTF